MLDEKSELDSALTIPWKKLYEYRFVLQSKKNISIKSEYYFYTFLFPQLSNLHGEVHVK